MQLSLSEYCMFSFYTNSSHYSMQVKVLR